MRLDPSLAAALVIGPVVQAATFRAYGRLRKPLTEVAEDIVGAVWAAVSAAANTRE